MIGRDYFVVFEVDNIREIVDFINITSNDFAFFAKICLHLVFRMIITLSCFSGFTYNTSLAPDLIRVS